MTEPQLQKAARLIQQQQRYIGRLVNLLLRVMDDDPNGKIEATEFIFVETTLYEYIDVGEETKKPGEK